MIAVGFLILFSAEAQTKAPSAPSAPEAPVVTGTFPDRRLFEFPSIPSIPPIPGFEGEASEFSRITDSYELTVLGAYPNGNTGNNTANTIKSALFILYSNRNMEFKFLFNDGTQYIYHLRNPGNKIETGTGVYKETYETSVQAGNRFLLGTYYGEVSYNENSVISFNLYENNRVIVLIDVRKINKE